MKHLFIINGLARTDRKKKKDLTRLLAQLEGLDGELAIEYTEHPHRGAEVIAREWAEKGEPLRIYACGGDGTLSEVVNGAAGYDHVAVTNVPLGTGNDFLKIFGPDFRKQFFDVRALMDGPEATFDLMECNGRLGIDVICVGVDARIAADVEKYKKWPLVRGMGAYILALIENVTLKGISRHMKVQMGERDYDEEIALACVCNGRHYGGGFMPVGDAMPDDGVLDMLLVRKVSLLTLVRVIGAYAKGQYRKYPRYIDHFHGQELRYSSPNGEDLITVIDGEVFHGSDFTVRLSDRRISFFYPAGADYHLSGAVGAAREV